MDTRFGIGRATFWKSELKGRAAEFSSVMPGNDPGVVEAAGPTTMSF